MNHNFPQIAIGPDSTSATTKPIDQILVNHRPATISLLSNTEVAASPLLPSLVPLINAAFGSQGRADRGKELFPPSRNRLQSPEHFLENIGPDAFTIVISQSSPPDSSSTFKTHENNEHQSPRAIATASARLFIGVSSTTFTPADSPFTRSLPAVPLAPNIQQWELKLMAVDPALQRQGLAGILLIHVTAEVRRRAALIEAERKKNGGEGEAEVRMILTTIKEINFEWYEKRGFRWTAEKKVEKGVMGSRDGFTVVEMGKAL